MTTRHRLANRRMLETIAVEHDSQRYKIGLGRAFGEVEVREVFLNAQQVNSTLDVISSDGAILMSMPLQYGCPPADIAHAMKRNPDGSRRPRRSGRAAAFLIEGEQ